MDNVTIAYLKEYVNETIDGSGGLKGKDGREVELEFSNTDSNVQWRYVGEKIGTAHV